jgi:hypothetical protein
MYPAFLGLLFGKPVAIMGSRSGKRGQIIPTS